MIVRGHFDTALNELHARLHDLSELTANAVARSIDALERGDLALAAEIIAEDKLTDEAQRRLEQFAVTLIATQQPVAGDLRRIIESILVGAELERIGDYAKRIARMTDGGPIPSGLHQLGEAAHAILEHALTALDQQDVDAAEGIGREELTVDEYYEQARSELIASFSADPEVVRRSADQLAIAHSFERIADRATNIAERIIFARNGDMVELNP